MRKCEICNKLKKDVEEHDLLGKTFLCFNCLEGLYKMTMKIDKEIKKVPEDIRKNFKTIPITIKL